MKSSEGVLWNSSAGTEVVDEDNARVFKNKKTPNFFYVSVEFFLAQARNT